MPITPKDIALAEQQSGGPAPAAEVPRPPHRQNHKNKTPLKRLMYMREYNKRRKMAKLADEYGYIKISDDATPDEIREAAKTGVSASVRGLRSRDDLLQKFESLAASGNDMAAIAALKAWAELAGIGPEARDDGALTPDQAQAYASRLAKATQSRLAASGAVIVQIVSASGADRFEGTPTEALDWVRSRLEATTGCGHDEFPSAPAPQDTQVSQYQADTQADKGM